MSEFRPSAPAVIGDTETGSPILYTGAHSRNLVLATQRQLEAVGKGLFDWANSKDGRLDDYYKTIFPKTIVKQVEVDDRRGIVDLLGDLDAEDAHRARIAPPPAKVVEAEFENFAPVKVGLDDGDEDD